MIPPRRVWSCVLDRMDEEDFIKIILKNMFLSLLLIGFLWLIVNILHPLFDIIFGIGRFAISVPLEYFFIGWLTFFGICYVFRLWEGLPWKANAWWKLAKFSIFTIIFYNVLLTCGELIGSSLIIAGILVTILFIIGEAVFTTILTYREFNQWVENIKKQGEMVQATQNTPDTNATP